ncbi:MAG: hypothetical protein ACO1N2_03605 [Candidatus Saccharimonadota bacterium]
MDQYSQSDIPPIGMQPESTLERLQREHFDALIRIERKLEEISEKVDRNTRRMGIIMESLPQIPVTPIRVSEFKYDHKNKKLWADERYYIDFDGKQADLLARLFSKTGKPKKTHLDIDQLVEDSYDHATGKKLGPRTFYLRAKEVQKKIDEGFRTPNLMTVSLKEIYFNFDNRE